METKEYQVSATDKSDREYFPTYREAVKRAKALAALQTEPVFIDFHDGYELRDWYWTVTPTKVTKHA